MGERTQKKKTEMLNIKKQGRCAITTVKTRNLCMGWRSKKKTTGKAKDQLTVLAVPSSLHHQ